MENLKDDIVEDASDWDCEEDEDDEVRSDWMNLSEMRLWLWNFIRFGF